MSEVQPPKSPWEDFQTVGSEMPPRERRGSWTAWLWLLLLTTIVGAVLSIFVMFEWEGGRSGRTLDNLDVTEIRRVSEEEANRLMAEWMIGGAAVGFLVGLGMWANFVLRGGGEK